MGDYIQIVIAKMEYERRKNDDMCVDQKSECNYNQPDKKQTRATKRVSLYENFILNRFITIV